MTAWEDALKIAEKIAKCAVDERYNQGMVYQVRDYAAPMICAALERAAAQEREGCIDIALRKSAKLPNDSDFTRGYACGREGAADDIRVRRPPQDSGNRT